MFRRAAREIRVIGGLLLIVAAVIVGLVELNKVTGQADRDFALCGQPGTSPPGCVSRREPVSVSWTVSSDNGFKREYAVQIQSSPSLTISFGGLSKADAEPFQGMKSAETRYHDGRLVAIVASNGTPYEFPFAFSKELGIVLGSASLVGLLGMGSVAWGFTRVNRTPKD